MNAESGLQQHWQEIGTVCLKMGAMSYGGPAIIGMLQAELQEKRNWVSKEYFVEGLALINMLPGAGATQLSIFLGHARGGWWGGLLAGLCFVLPAFLIMLALTWAYLRYGTLPSMRGVFYGLSPVVVALFLIAVWRLGNTVIKDWQQIVFAVITAVLLAFTPVGIVTLLLLAGALGVALYGARREGLNAAIVIITGYMLWHFFGVMQMVNHGVANKESALFDIGLFFFKIGAFTFGGGLSVLAFMQEQVVNQSQWLTQQQFLDGLALGQLTPGPILMIAAFVGYQKASVPGAFIAALAIFLPSFLLMLGIVPAFDRIKRVNWMKAALKGISPAVIGMIGVAMIKMLPAAVVDWITALIFTGVVTILFLRRPGPLPVMFAGGLIGWLVNLKQK